MLSKKLYIQTKKSHLTNAWLRTTKRSWFNEASGGGEKD